MPFTVVANPGTAPTPQIVPPSCVVREARKGGNPDAELALAYTYPVINVSWTGLIYRQRLGKSGTELSFDTGTLTLTLCQDMYVANSLSPCAQAKWIAHENGHVSDNIGVMGRMDAGIRANATLQSLFLTRRWFPIAAFAATERAIKHEVAAVFLSLTSEAVLARDTRIEYMRVHPDVLLNCPGPYVYEVVRGDSLSQIAEFFYGRSIEWKAIYKANLAVIGPNPDLIRPGQNLVIPRTPGK